LLKEIQTARLFLCRAFLWWYAWVRRTGKWKWGMYILYVSIAVSYNKSWRTGTFFERNRKNV